VGGSPVAAWRRGVALNARILCAVNAGGAGLHGMKPTQSPEQVMGGKVENGERQNVHETRKRHDIMKAMPDRHRDVIQHHQTFLRARYHA